ncbi:STM4504/CBY_0614 family protein [Tenacibaculum aiptasiae]|uniref:STM4504/CBY_0614 family protein n=1 Tax=Tenacibaculum aiptasiae TaxID=426481 RepID=UPI00232F45B6|nr:hypothetical protein [Tenacibaculum aiptasiae]
MDDIYSIRNKKKTDDLVHDSISDKLKIQIIKIWKKFFNQFKEDVSENFWLQINNKISEEHGLETLLKDDLRRYKEYFRCESYFKRTKSVDECLDVIEVVFNSILLIEKKIVRRLKIQSEDLIKQLNKRFKENDFGYEFNQNRIVKINNKVLHKQIINKTIDLTNSPMFKNANEEFLLALEHLKEERNKEALNESLKSFESTMKIIINAKGWDYSEKDTSNKLIKKCFDNDLIPSYLQSQFSGLRSTLEAGIPTLRNRTSGHGQGPEQITVPNSLANYAVFITGACINLLIESFNDIK